MVKPAYDHRVLAPFGGHARKCTTKGTDLEQLLNFTKGLAGHSNNCMRDAPTSRALGYSITGLLELVTVDIIRLARQELLSGDQEHFGQNDVKATEDYTTPEIDRAYYHLRLQHSGTFNKDYRASKGNANMLDAARDYAWARAATTSSSSTTHAPPLRWGPTAMATATPLGATVAGAGNTNNLIPELYYAAWDSGCEHFDHHFK